MRRLLLLLPLLTACADESATTLTEGDGDHGLHEATHAREDVARYTPEEEWLVSDIIKTEAGATRVAILLELTASGEMPTIEGQPMDDDAPAADWAPLIATFSEEDTHVAVLDFAATAGGARLRLPAQDVDRIRLLTWSALTPQEETEDADDSIQQPLRSELQTDVVSRSEWGARATRCSTSDAAKTRMAVHYTVTSADNPPRRMRSIQAYHMDGRGWCDVGYHFLVGIDGNVYEGRPEHLQGAHVGGHNRGNAGVSFIGCFHPSGCGSFPPNNPPDAMINAGARIIDTLGDLYGITRNRNNVKGHREHRGTSTSCPGDNLLARIDDLIGGPSGDLGVTDVAPTETGADCTHTYGGVYDHQGCSAGFQCCSGSWISRTAGCGDCVCLEETGTDGCREAAPPTGGGSACAGLACGACEDTEDCDYCASQGACGEASASCEWRGGIQTGFCWDTFWPCWLAECWNPTAELARCGTWSLDEDFSSGSFAVHRYWAEIPAGGHTTVRMERTAGGFAPALVITDRSGELIYGGEASPLHSDVRVTYALSGRADGIAEAVLAADSNIEVLIYVTGWSVIDSAFLDGMPTSSQYELLLAHDCTSR